jgi:hypothetical protein
MSCSRTTRGGGWQHNRKPIDLSSCVTICPQCGRINPYLPPTAVHDEQGFIDPFAINRWTKLAVCAGCGQDLTACNTKKRQVDDS